MIVRAELKPDQERRILQEAKSAGTDPESYWSGIVDGLAEARMAETRRALFELSDSTVIGKRRREIEERLRHMAEQTTPKPTPPDGTPEERLASYRSWVGDRNPDASVPTPDAYDRETLYDDRV